MQKTIVEKHFNKVAKNYDSYKEKNSFYYNNLKKLLKRLIPQHKNIFEFGCGTGDLIASFNPESSIGYDPSIEMIKIAKKKHISISFTTKLPKKIFNYIFMSDVIEHLENPEEEFRKISKLMNNKTSFIITMANPIWEPLLMFWEKMGWKMPEGPHRRISAANLELIMKNLKLTIIKHDYKLLIPIQIPVITKFANKYLERLLKKIAFIEYFVIKKEIK